MNQKPSKNPKFKVGQKVIVQGYNQIGVILGCEKFKTKNDIIYFYTIDVVIKGKKERHYFNEDQLRGA